MLLQLLVCTWRHGGHVGGQEQKHFYFHVNSSRKYSFVLTPNIAALSRGCKARIRYSPNERQNIVNSTVFLRQIVFCLFQNFFYENKTRVSSPTSNVNCWRNYVQNNIPQHNKFIFLGIKSYGNNLAVFLFQNKVSHQSNALLITSLLHV